MLLGTRISLHGCGARSRETSSGHPRARAGARARRRRKTRTLPVRERADRALAPCRAARQSVSQVFHGPAPRSPHRLAVRLRRSRSNTSTEFSLPGAYSIVASEVSLSQRTGCSPVAFCPVLLGAPAPCVQDWVLRRVYCFDRSCTLIQEIGDQQRYLCCFD